MRCIRTPRNANATDVWSGWMTEDITQCGMLAGFAGWNVML